MDPRIKSEDDKVGTNPCVRPKGRVNYEDKREVESVTRFDEKEQDRCLLYSKQ
jgi:hypothetical protein